MRPCILVIAPESATLLGLAQAMLKFGYHIVTAYPDPEELERVEKTPPWMVVLRPPARQEERRRCLDMIKTRFQDRGVPVLACVTSPEEARAAQEQLRGSVVLVGNPLRLNDLYKRMQDLFKLARRRELRITTNLVVAHREPGLYQDDFYYYDTMTSLSCGGCFIQTENPYPVGTAVELLFCIGSGSRSLKVLGRVCRHGTGGPGAEQGMGIGFVDLTESTRAALQSFMMSQIGTADLPSTL